MSAVATNRLSVPMRGIVVALLAMWGVSAAAFTPPPVPTNLFDDEAGATTADYARRLDEELAQLDGGTPGRLRVILYRESPDGPIDEFTAAAAARWERTDPKLENGAILFYFIKAKQVRVSTGARLATQLPPGALSRTAMEVFSRGGATITYPDSLEKCARRIGAEMRDAFERPAPGRGLVASLRWTLTSRVRSFRADAGADFWFFLFGGIAFLLFVARTVFVRFHDISTTISSGRRRHESAQQIAAEVAAKVAMDAAALGVEVVAEGAANVVGGGFSGGGGSFGGGGASGKW